MGKCRALDIFINMQLIILKDRESYPEKLAAWIVRLDEEYRGEIYDDEIRYIN